MRLRLAVTIACMLALVAATMPAGAAAEPDSPIFGLGPLDMPPTGMFFENWAPNSELLIEIYDPDTAEPVDYATTVTTDEEGFGFLPELAYYEVRPGELVTVSHGEDVKTLTVADVHVTAADLVMDVVTGTCAPGTQVLVSLSEPGSSIALAQLWTTAGADGAWTVDFSGIWDIQHHLVVDAHQWDEDGDWTWASLYVPSIPLEDLLVEMVEDGRLPDQRTAERILKMAQNANYQATNYLKTLVRREVISQQTMDEILLSAGA